MQRLNILREIITAAISREVSRRTRLPEEEIFARRPDIALLRRNGAAGYLQFIGDSFTCGRRYRFHAELTAHPHVLNRLPPAKGRRWFAIRRFAVADSSYGLEWSTADLRALHARYCWDFTAVGVWGPEEDWTDVICVYWSEERAHLRVVHEPLRGSSGSNSQSAPGYRLVYAQPTRRGGNAENWYRLWSAGGKNMKF